MKEYQTPLEFTNVRDLGIRGLYKTEVKFDFIPPAGNSKKFRPYRKMKEHVEFTAKILPVLDQSELYKILSGIEKEDVHWFWKDIVSYLWNLKRTNKFAEQILLNEGKVILTFGDGEIDLEIIEYPDTARFVNKYE